MTDTNSNISNSNVRGETSMDCPLIGRIVLGELDLPLMRPTTPAALANLVRDAAQTQTAVYPVGGRTRTRLGRLPEKPGTAIDMTALDAVIDYPSADMTITVQTGITIAKLAKILAEKGQRLPIDSIDPEKETIGGLIATNASGPRRLGHGTLRDYVIGIKYLNDQGEEAKAGGRVVKNVAGYDLCKLQTGALGTLGILTEVTFKLRPVPEARAIVLLHCFAANLQAAAHAVHGSSTRPVSVDVLNPRASLALFQNGLVNPDPGHTELNGWYIAVGFEENGPATRWQVETLTQEMSLWKPTTLQDGKEEAFWQALTSLGQHWPGSNLSTDVPITLKATARASDVHYVLTKANELGAEGRVTGHLENGIARVHFPGDTPVEKIQEFTAKLRGLALERGGNLVVESGSPSHLKAVVVWGEPRADHEVARRVHREMDPLKIFNPGRFLPGT